MIKKLSLLLFVFGLSRSISLAQCAMCRSTIVNNVSNGNELELAAGLNTGILYLFVAPYLLVGLIAFMWYRSAKSNKSTSKSH